MSVNEEYELELVRTEAELRELEPDWRRLQEESRPRNPFLSWGWTRACWEDLCQGGTPFVPVLRRAGEVVGVAPLCLARRGVFRVLRFIGDGRCDYLGFLTHPEVSDAEARLLAELARRRSQWDLALLRPLNSAYTTLGEEAVPASLRSAGVEGTRAYHVSHPGDWKGVCADGPGWLRRMPKELRRFEREGGTTERWTGAAAAALVELVSDIEARSWKGQTGVARFPRGSGQAFLRHALSAPDTAESLELWTARIDGYPVAYALNLLTPERVMIYQGAYDPAYKRQGAGAVLQFQAIRRAWEAGAREYDYMNGDEPYKADRTNASRAIRYLALYPPSLVGYAALAVLVAPRWQLKGVRPVRAAHHWWTRWRAGMGLRLPVPARSRG